MNCNEIRNKLPSYLAGECGTEERIEISNHISGCHDCRNTLDELDIPILNDAAYSKALDTAKIFKKARKTLILRVAAISLLSILSLISIFFVVVPGILKDIRYPKLPDITRALIDVTQFSSPSPVVGYGNSLASFGKYDFNISVFTADITGTKKKNSAAITRNFNMLTGNFQSTIPHTSQFIHPKVKVSDEIIKESDPNISNKILNKNADTTVATVDLSLNSTISLENAASALKDLDLKVIWLAVECGSEGAQPKNMNTNKNQYVQWGIPGQLYTSYAANSVEFNSTNLSQYKKSIYEELEWLDKNKKYISAEKSLLKFNAFDNSVGDKAKYVIDTGFKVYGLRITGPSSELLKLKDKFDIRIEDIFDLDFYYWH